MIRRSQDRFRRISVLLFGHSLGIFCDKLGTRGSAVVRSDIYDKSFSAAVPPYPLWPRCFFCALIKVHVPFALFFIFFRGSSGYLVRLTQLLDATLHYLAVPIYMAY